MTKEDKINKYINTNYKWLLGEVKQNIAKDGMREYAEDLLHTIILDLYNLADEKITQMIDDDMLKWYILRGCGLQLRSNTSPFYRLHRREKMQSRDNYNHNSPEASDSFSGMGILDSVYEPYDSLIDDLTKCMEANLDELGFYYRTLVEKHFIEKWSLQRIHEYYQISKNHIIKDINYALDYIRTNCNQIEIQ